LAIEDGVDEAIDERIVVDDRDTTFVDDAPSSTPSSPGRLLTLWRRNALKLTLIAGDLGGLLLGSIVGHWLSGYLHHSAPWQRAVVTLVVAVAGVWCIRSQGLLLARTSSVRVVELTKLSRAVMMLGVVLLLADRVLRLDLHIEQAIAACVAIFVALVMWRSAYRAWLTHARSRGRYLRPTLVMGADGEVGRLVDLLVTHRELGMDVLGLVGGSGDGRLADMWLGDIDDAEDLVRDVGASGVIVSPIGIEPARFNALIRNLQRDGVHVFVSTGLSGIESRRLRSMALAHEPMLYVEPPKFNRSQSALKRAFDIVVAGVLLLLAAPVMAIVALVVKLGDRGPVFFRQERIGRNGVPFRVVKFRTMFIDAEARLAALKADNERHGPLFKMAVDPRVTRPGRWLRESSLDELPQLFNVLRGQMSLVGPRPALPSEVEHFSPELRTRELVMPGITGLWQVEARDNPSFEAYRRLDLFYVENWSLTLDLLIVLATIEHIAVRLVTQLSGKSSRT
jgi:exopolysaccharide biosynthesis polyprenyl glycosylphosphotransferase